jgi:hypothetical protein
MVDLDLDNEDVLESTEELLSRHSSPSAPSETESIQQPTANDVVSPFHLAFGLWCEKSSVSRTDYKRLREVWELGQRITTLSDDDEALLSLPLKLDTLKRIVRSHLPLLRLMRKPITVRIDKQPTFPSKEKDQHKQQQQQSVLIRKV